jgi:hypothetical protein
VVKTIVGVLSAVLFLVYCAAVVFWNANTKVSVVTFQAGPQCLWVGGVPIGFLPLVGLAIGVIAMGIAAIFPWAGQRRRAREAEEKLQKAMARLAEQKRALAARDEQIEGLNAQLQPAAEVAEVELGSMSDVADAGGETTPAVGTDPSVV